MSLVDFEEERPSNPVDVIEQIAALNDWSFERAADDEITISIEGTIPTNEGDMKPTCSVNIAPPMAHMTADMQKANVLKLATS